MARPLYRTDSESKIIGLRGDVGRLQRRPLTGEWINPAAFYDDPDNLTVSRDLLTEQGTGWTQPGGMPGHRFRRHMDGTLEMRGYLEPGASGTVAYTLPGVLDTEVDYRPDVDCSFLADISTGPSTFAIARIQVDSTTGDVTITYPAT